MGLLAHSRTAAAGTPATAPTSAAPWQASPWSQDGAAAHAGGRPPLTAEHVCGTTLDRLPDHERPSLAGNACGLSGGDAATLLDLQELLLLPPSEQPDLCDLLTGHESDGSGCSGASHLSVRSDAAAAAPAQPPLLSPGWCMPSPPHQQQPHSVSMPGGCLPMMPVPADSLHVRPAPAEGAALCGWLEPGWESGTAGDDASDTDLMQWLVSAVPDSTGSSPGRAQQEHAAACLPGQSAGAGSAELCAALSGSMVGAAPAQSRPAVGCGTAASAPCKKRGRGRPRRYDTTLPLSPGTTPSLPLWLGTLFHQTTIFPIPAAAHIQEQGHMCIEMGCEWRRCSRCMFCLVPKLLQMSYTLLVVLMYQMPKCGDTNQLALLLCAGLMQAQMGGALSNQVNGMDEGQRKKTRGAKPKYKFQTAEEAVAYR